MALVLEVVTIVSLREEVGMVRSTLCRCHRCNSVTAGPNYCTSCGVVLFPTSPDGTDWSLYGDSSKEQWDGVWHEAFVEEDFRNIITDIKETLIDQLAKAEAALEWALKHGVRAPILVPFGKTEKECTLLVSDGYGCEDEIDPPEALQQYITDFVRETLL